MFFLLRYFKVLIQEMDVKIDMSFIMACIGLFSFDTIDRSQEVRMRLLHWAAYPRGYDKTKTKVGVEKIWIEPDRTG